MLRWPRLVLAAVVLALPACSSSTAAAPDRLDVVAAFYPLQFLAERVGGDAVRVQSLTPAGAEPHDLELTPRQTAALQEADVVAYLRDLQPQVDAALANGTGARRVDAAAVTPLERGDPHVWLDPLRMRDLAGAVADALATGPAAADVRARADRLRAELTELDAAYRRGLADCARRDLVTSHESFGYLARRYGLRQIGITGLSPEAEPTPRQFAEILTYARERDVTTVFFEEAVSPKTVQVLADELGAEARVLSPLETPPAAGDYLTAMRANLDALRAALSCS